MMFAAKDFIETAEGLIFAVVDHRLEDGKALCFLRYVKDGEGWKKYTTADANALLNRHYPGYLHYSRTLDANLHAVKVSRIVRHHQPRQRLQEIISEYQPDSVERDLIDLYRLFQQQDLDITQIGVTGSLLVGAQQADSDIDLVCYGREAFHQCRAIITDLIVNGRLQALHGRDWLESYRRRDCSLSYEDYVWHERRKFNKALINGRKFDLNLIESGDATHPVNNRKCGAVTLQCRIIDDSRGFDYPAVYKIEHETIDAIVCFTATYTGQAFIGETVEVSGMLEQTEQGRQIVVGSTREAHGEYIKVIDA
jgi:predicted nucleotidyltransferase